MDIVDLAYIIRSGQYPSKKAAAIALLAHQLGQPQTLESARRFGPKVIGDNKYLEEQQYDSMMRALFYGFVPMLILAFVALDIAHTAIQKIVQGEPWLLTILLALVSALILAIPLGWFARSKWKQELDRYRNYRDGREGEEWVTETVRATLDNRWTVFRGVRLPGHREDIDLVLAGPAGVWALEVKAFKTSVRVREKKWEYLRGSKWHSLDNDPVAQARKNAVHLRFYLEQYGIRAYVNAAVVLTEPQQQSNFGPTEEPVWLHFEVENQLTRLNDLPPTQADQVKEKVVAAVSKVVDLGGKSPNGPS
jgi:hypothetical protein